MVPLAQTGILNSWFNIVKEIDNQTDFGGHMNVTGTAQNVWLQLYPCLTNWEILILGGTWISDANEGIKILAGSGRLTSSWQGVQDDTRPREPFPVITPPTRENRQIYS